MRLLLLQVLRPHRHRQGAWVNALESARHGGHVWRVVERFLEDDSLKQQRAMAELLNIVPHLAALIKQASKA